MKTLTIKNISYQVTEHQTTEEMKSSLPNLAADLERRGFTGSGVCRRPNGRKHWEFYTSDQGACLVTAIS